MEVHFGGMEPIGKNMLDLFLQSYNQLSRKELITAIGS